MTMIPPSRQTWQVQKAQGLLGEGTGAKLVFLIIGLAVFVGAVLLVLYMI